MKHNAISIHVRTRISALAIMTMFSMGNGLMAQTNTSAAAKNIVLVHGACVDGSGWKPVYEILTGDGYSVSVVQEPLTSLDNDVAATKQFYGSLFGWTFQDWGPDYASFADAGIDGGFSPAHWVTSSLIARIFAKRGRSTRELRNPILVLILLAFFRFVFFPALWLGNRQGRGDCLLVMARKA